MVHWPVLSRVPNRSQLFPHDFIPREVGALRFTNPTESSLASLVGLNDDCTLKLEVVTPDSVPWFWINIHHLSARHVMNFLFNGQQWLPMIQTEKVLQAVNCKGLFLYTPDFHIMTGLVKLFLSLE